MNPKRLSLALCAIALSVAPLRSALAQQKSRVTVSKISRQKVKRARTPNASNPSPQASRLRVSSPLQSSQNRKSRGATKELLSNAGIPTLRLSKVMDHVALGLPTAASRNSPENFLLARNQYVASYSKTRKTPNWVSWSLKAGDIAGTSRQNNFRADHTIPKDWGRATKRDYKGSGYTRGHLVASGERLSDSRSNSKTFVLTNVVPQLEASNRGPWLHLESFYRDQVARQNKDVYVIAGGLYKGTPKTIGKNQVAIPTSTWKVVVLVDRGKGLAGVTEASRVVSVIVPNEPGKVSVKQPFSDFRVTAREIQKQAGVELFAHLPHKLRATLLDKLDTQKIPKLFMAPNQKKRRKKSLSASN